MKNKEAKILMLNCVKPCDNGECYIVNQVSIKTGNLAIGSVISRSSYIGDIDSDRALNAVCELVTQLAISKIEKLR